MTEQAAPSRRARMLFVAGAVALWVGVGAALTAAAPNYSDWSEPVNLGPTVNSEFGEISPALPKDGLSLYFNTALRPGGLGSNDIWVAQRDSVDDEWGAPVNLGAPINTAASEDAPAFSRDGHWLFFYSFNRPGGVGLNDIWASWRPNIHDDFGWQEPSNVGGGVNSAFGEFGPSYFANDGGAPQRFFTSNRPGGLGGQDIYMSELQPDGTWGPATSIPELNSSGLDAGPSISHDGLEIFFGSNRAGGLGDTDTWVATRETVDAPWSTPVNLGAPVNSS